MPSEWGMVLLAGWNLVALMLYGADKLRAKRGARRIPERTLLACSVLLGGAGGLAGMLLFRHKTRKILFYLANLVGLAAVVALVVIAWVPG